MRIRPKNSFFLAVRQKIIYTVLLYLTKGGDSLKKAACILLALILTVSLTACNKTNSDDTTSNDAVLIPESSSSIVITPETSSEQESFASSEPESSKQSVSEQESYTSSSKSSSASSKPASSASSSASSSKKPESSSVSSQQSSSKPQNNNLGTAPEGETKAVWISYLEYQSILTGKTKKQFSSSIESMFSKLAADGFNTVFVHARSHSDAMYESSIFPWSVYCAGTEGTSPGFDPLAIMVEKAHNCGLKIEAWINPYRIKGTDDTSKISSGSPAYDWLGTEKVKVIAKTGIFYNPADSEVIELIVEGVEEIVRNYDVDGIHFDDYFYPTTDAGFDSTYYTAYKNSGGKLGLAAWRRQNVNTLVKEVYSAIKSIDSGCVFGISPAGNMSTNYDTLYCDVYTWASSSGYVDYICPQIYWGFNHKTTPFLDVLDIFDSMITNSNVKLIVGLASYKIGVSDSYAGDGKNEWVNNNDIISREVTAARNADNYGGFALYRYDSVYSSSAAAKNELDSLKKVM